MRGGCSPGEASVRLDPIVACHSVAASQNPTTRGRARSPWDARNEAIETRLQGASACCKDCPMSSPSQLRTARLLLRRWRETDHAPFAALNGDPMVMEYFPDRLTRAESDDLIARIEAGFDSRGYGLWALEVRATGEFVGFTGLAVPSFNSHFTPAVED